MQGGGRGTNYSNLFCVNWEGMGVADSSTVSPERPPYSHNEWYWSVLWCSAEKNKTKKLELQCVSNVTLSTSVGKDAIT